MSRLNAFVDHLIEFLDDLRQTFNEVIEIQAAYNQLNIWGDTTAVKQRSLKAFMYCCAPLYEEIFRENEEFFTDMERLKKVKNQKQFEYYVGNDDNEQEQKMMTILQLKGYITDLSTTNKGKIWAHMKALLIKGAGTVLNSPYTPREDEKEQWDNMTMYCRELVAFAKSNPELYRTANK